MSDVATTVWGEIDGRTITFPMEVAAMDAATLVFSVPAAVASAPGFDATVEFMRGRVKATGHSGDVLELLKSGAATEALSRLASQP